MAARLKLVIPEAENRSDPETPIVRPIRRPVLPEDAEHPGGFHSPMGAERGGPAIRQYYNPRPGVLAKKQRIRKAGAALFARYGVSATGLDRVAEAARMPRRAADASRPAH